MLGFLVEYIDIGTLQVIHPEIWQLFPDIVLGGAQHGDDRVIHVNDVVVGGADHDVGLHCIQRSAHPGGLCELLLRLVHPIGEADLGGGHVLQQRTDLVGTVIFHPVGVVPLCHLPELGHGSAQGLHNLLAQPECIAAEDCKGSDQPNTHSQGASKGPGDASADQAHQYRKGGKQEQVISDTQPLQLMLQAAAVGGLHRPPVGIQLVVEFLSVPQLLLAG